MYPKTWATVQTSLCYCWSLCRRHFNSVVQESIHSTCNSCSLYAAARYCSAGCCTWKFQNLSVCIFYMTVHTLKFHYHSHTVLFFTASCTQIMFSTWWLSTSFTCAVCSVQCACVVTHSSNNNVLWSATMWVWVVCMPPCRWIVLKALSNLMLAEVRVEVVLILTAESTWSPLLFITEQC